MSATVSPLNRELRGNGWTCYVRRADGGHVAGPTDESPMYIGWEGGRGGKPVENPRVAACDYCRENLRHSFAAHESNLANARNRRAASAA